MRSLQTLHLLLHAFFFLFPLVCLRSEVPCQAGLDVLEHVFVQRSLALQRAVEGVLLFRAAHPQLVQLLRQVGHPLRPVRVGFLLLRLLLLLQVLQSLLELELLLLPEALRLLPLRHVLLHFLEGDPCLLDLRVAVSHNLLDLLLVAGGHRPQVQVRLIVLRVQVENHLGQLGDLFRHLVEGVRVRPMMLLRCRHLPSSSHQ
mmetsp:Transcript_17332/g.43114  ORF Transcript_17332/g.43114 Transcript_17332/m.43114 type:complete len:202 (+) Transcript_17332:2418-3023(+)